MGQAEHSTSLLLLGALPDSKDAGLLDEALELPDLQVITTSMTSFEFQTATLDRRDMKVTKYGNANRCSTSSAQRDIHAVAPLRPTSWSLWSDAPSALQPAWLGL